MLAEDTGKAKGKEAPLDLDRTDRGVSGEDTAILRARARGSQTEKKKKNEKTIIELDVSSSIQQKYAILMKCVWWAGHACHAAMQCDASFHGSRYRTDMYVRTRLAIRRT